MRLLYIQGGLTPPPRDPSRDRMFYVPDSVVGDILLPTWLKTEEEAREALGQDSYPEHKVKNFTYHVFLAGRWEYGTLRQKWEIFKFFLSRGLALNRKEKFDCIMCYGWQLTGIAALLLRRRTGAKLIVELGNTPHAVYGYSTFGNAYGSPKKTLATRMARFASEVLIRLVVGGASRLQLRYPTQLDHYPRLQNVPVSVIHSFTPVHRIPFTGNSDGSVLLVGAPWYVKGVDVLIRAFRKIEKEFPAVNLRLVGYYPDRKELDAMVGDSKQIQFLGAKPNPETLKIIADSGVFVSASRTDAGARVLIEAMAAGKPVIASKMDGTPYYVQDGVNGLLFETANSDELAEKLSFLLRNPELQQRLGRKGLELARGHYDESTFGRKFAEMVALAAGKSPSNTRTQSAAL